MCERQKQKFTKQEIITLIENLSLSIEIKDEIVLKLKELLKTV